METTAKTTTPRKTTRKPSVVKAVVACPFTDAKADGRVFYTGETFEGSKARVDELKDKGFLEV